MELPETVAGPQVISTPEAAARIAELEARVHALERRLAEAETAGHDAGAPLRGTLVEVLDAVESFVVLLDYEGHVLFLNRACEDFAKLRSQDAKGRLIWDLFDDPAQADIAIKAFGPLREGRGDNELKRFWRIKTDRVYYIEWATRLIERGPGLLPDVLITGVEVTKRHKAEQALKFQLRFERLVSRISQMLVSLSPDELEDGLRLALCELASFLNVDACSVWLFNADGNGIDASYVWRREESALQPALSADAIVRLMKASGREPVVVNGDDGRRDVLKVLEDNGQTWPVAFLAIPLLCAGRTVGCLSAEAVNPRAWDAEVTRLATVIAKLLAGSLERSRSQRALRESEERMRSVVEKMPVMMCAIEFPPDFDQPEVSYRIIVWNEECERVTGYRADEIVGQDEQQQLLLPSQDYWHKVVAEWRELGHDFRNQEWNIRAKDGSVRTIAWSNMTGRVPIPGWGAWGIGIDVTDQVEARNALKRAHDELEERVAARTEELRAANEHLKREMESREAAERTLLRQTRILRAVLDSIADGVVVADESGSFLLFNRSAERILHIGPVEAPPSEWSRVYGLYLPDGRTPYPADQLPLVRAIRGETPGETLIYIDREQGPKDSWLSVHACPLLDETGKMRGGVAVFRDITEHRRAQEQLHAERQLLEQLLRAHERDRQLLAYEIHDGLVQEITGALMHLEAYDSRSHAEAARNEDFQRAVRLLRITMDEARRVITGLRPPILDEQGIVAAIEYLINEHAGLNTIPIGFHHDVRANRFDPLLDGTIYRIVQEALTNIRRHSAASHGEVSLVQQEGLLRLQICDDGVGFDASRVEENRFGLSGIRERARLLRGTARIESAPGKGTRIFVELPVAFPQGERT